MLFITKPKTFGEKLPFFILSSVILYALRFKFSNQKAWYNGYEPLCFICVRVTSIIIKHIHGRSVDIVCYGHLNLGIEFCIVFYNLLGYICRGSIIEYYC